MALTVQRHLLDRSAAFHITTLEAVALPLAGSKEAAVIADRMLCDHLESVKVLASFIRRAVSFNDDALSRKMLKRDLLLPLLRHAFDVASMLTQLRRVNSAAYGLDLWHIHLA